MDSTGLSIIVRAHQRLTGEGCTAGIGQRVAAGSAAARSHRRGGPHRPRHPAGRAHQRALGAPRGRAPHSASRSSAGRGRSSPTSSSPSARRSPSATATGEVVYANRAALRSLGFATLEDLRRHGLEAVMADYVVHDEHGREVSMDDIPGVRLLRRRARSAAAAAPQRQPADRRSALGAAQGLAAAQRRGRDDRCGDDDRGRHRRQDRRGPHERPGGVRPAAQRLARLSADASQRRPRRDPQTRRLVHGRARRSRRPP